MRFHLVREDNHTQIVAESDELKSDFAASDWARAWLKEHAEHDRYRLRREDGAKPMLMIRTVAGQWYAMPLAEEAESVPA